MKDRGDGGSRHDGLERELQALPNTAVMLLTLGAIAAGGAIGAHGFARDGSARTRPDITTSTPSTGRGAAGSRARMQAAPEGDRPSPVPGLDDALRRGLLAPGDDTDIAAWAARHRARIGPLGDAASRRLADATVYIVRGDLDYPAGTRATVFVVPAGRRAPRGNPGASPVLEMATGACLGTGCRALH